MRSARAPARSTPARSTDPTQPLTDDVHAASRPHHPPDPRGHVRDVRHDPLDGHRLRAGRARARRQRVRRGHRRRVRPPHRRAAPERAGRRPHRGVRHRVGPDPDRPRRAGTRTGRRHASSTTAPRDSSWCPGPAAWPRPCPARWTRGSSCCATTAPGSSPTCWRSPSGTRVTGIPSSRGCARRSRPSPALFTEHWPSSAERWLPGGRVPQPGELISDPGVRARARGAGRGGRGGADPRGTDRGRPDASGAPGGWPGRRPPSSRQPHRHSSGTDHAAVITADDFAGFEADVRAGRHARLPRPHDREDRRRGARDRRCCRRSPSSTGFDDERLDPSTALGAHTILEAQKLAYADRDAYYGDDARAPGCAALGRLRGRAASAHRRHRLRGVPSGRRPRRRHRSSRRCASTTSRPPARVPAARVSASRP